MTPFAPPATKPPKPGADWNVRMCYMQFLPGRFEWTGTAQWVGQAPQPPSLVDQAREASGEIVLPTARLEFNPPTRTLVNLHTWYWAQGLTEAELRGTSAFGLVAIATPGQLEITPGDGSASFSCAWVTGKSDRCLYTYRRASVGGPLIGANGRPAYRATGVATWTLRFEENGVPVPIAGAPTEISGPAMTSAVEVGEVQTLVTGVR